MKNSPNKSKSKKKIELKPIEKPQKRFHTIENNFSEHFPKNANEFGYIIDDINAKGNQRRRYENIFIIFERR